jgi:hypothetical protein
MNSNENTHDPLVERALVSFDLAAEHHIANCQPCQTKRDRVEDALRQFAAANREYANRPETFWELQAARIRSVNKDSDARSRLTLSLVPSLVILLLAAFAILGRAPGLRPVVPPIAAAPQVDADHELLLEVERAIQTDTPLALEPVTLMVDESDGNLPLDTTSEEKEIRSHDN